MVELEVLGVSQAEEHQYPLVLLRHHARAVNQEYLLGQLYLEPHPKELMLRNHV